MKIKRFFAPDARQAMRMVREELGEDAVILSNKRVNGGVEIISAIDYDENVLAQEAESHQPQVRPQAYSQTPPSAPSHAQLHTSAPQTSQHNSGVSYEELAKEVPDTDMYTPASAPYPKEDASAFQTSRAEYPQSQNAFNDVQLKDVSNIPKENKPKPQIVWSQEPTLVEMRSELQNMRGMLEHQLASMGQKEQQMLNPHHYDLQRRLARLGFGSKLTENILAGLPDDGGLEESWRRVLGKIAVNIPVTNDDILTQGGVVALVGPTGVGKTTTIAKLAARYALRYGARSVALVSTDNFRIGAHEQLKAYSRILDIPIRFADSADSLQVALDYFCDKRLVLIDTAGMSQRDLRLNQRLSMFEREGERVKPYLVVSATSRLSGLSEIVHGFQGIKPQGCILTKLDEGATLGHAVDMIIQNQLPVAYVSDGQRVPEDLQPARAHTLVSRSVAMMQEHAHLLDNELPGLQVGEVGI
ncbi:flagellar biosynthesis protein FlhF [Pseudomonadota bacterium]